MAGCPSCGRESPQDARFCSFCGAALAAAEPSREARKIVTVLFADVVGSTALGEATDPEALRVRMRRYFEDLRRIVERHGGTVEKFAGDAIMAVFGIPRRARGRCASSRARRVGDARRDRGPRARGPHRSEHGRGRGRRHGRDADHGRRGERGSSARAGRPARRGDHRRRDPPARARRGPWPSQSSHSSSRGSPGRSRRFACSRS